MWLLGRGWSVIPMIHDHEVITIHSVSRWSIRTISRALDTQIGAGLRSVILMIHDHQVVYNTHLDKPVVDTHDQQSA